MTRHQRRLLQLICKQKHRLILFNNKLTVSKIQLVQNMSRPKDRITKIPITIIQILTHVTVAERILNTQVHTLPGTTEADKMKNTMDLTSKSIIFFHSMNFLLNTLYVYKIRCPSIRARSAC